MCFFKLTLLLALGRNVPTYVQTNVSTSGIEVTIAVSIPAFTKDITDAMLKILLTWHTCHKKRVNGNERQLRRYVIYFLLQLRTDLKEVLSDVNELTEQI